MRTTINDDKNMGYTHYYLPLTKPTKGQWNEFLTVCKKLYKNLPEKINTAGGCYENETLTISGWNGQGKPKFNKKEVRFNGSNELGHETFSIYFHTPVKNFNFCKTARKPYDLLVVACLIAAYQYLDYRFSSDGFNDDETCDDLQPAIDYYNTIIQPEEPITQIMLKKQSDEYHLI